MTNTLTYEVAGMSCDHCRAAISSEVARVGGVASVDVHLEQKLVQVRGESIDHEVVVAAIDEAGFDAVRT